MDVATTTKEKQDLAEVEEQLRANAHDDLNEEELAVLDRKIDLKLDCLVIPLVTMVYLLAFLDRANIGNARVVSLHARFLVSDSFVLHLD